MRIADELRNRRELDPANFIEDPWWRGVLVLFTQMNDSIDWLIRPFIHPYHARSTLDTLLAIINVRPESETTKYRREILKFVSQPVKMKG